MPVLQIVSLGYRAWSLQPIFLQLAGLLPLLPWFPSQSASPSTYCHPAWHRVCPSLAHSLECSMLSIPFQLSIPSYFPSYRASINHYSALVAEECLAPAQLLPLASYRARGGGADVTGLCRLYGQEPGVPTILNIKISAPRDDILCLQAFNQDFKCAKRYLQPLTTSSKTLISQRSIPYQDWVMDNDYWIEAESSLEDYWEVWGRAAHDPARWPDARLQRSYRGVGRSEDSWNYQRCEYTVRWKMKLARSGPGTQTPSPSTPSCGDLRLRQIVSVMKQSLPASILFLSEPRSSCGPTKPIQARPSASSSRRGSKALRWWRGSADARRSGIRPSTASNEDSKGPQISPLPGLSSRSKREKPSFRCNTSPDRACSASQMHAERTRHR